MKPISFIFIFILALASCTVPGSLHPLTKNASDLYYNPELAGQWEERVNSPDETYLITPGDDPNDQIYNCAIISNDNNKDTAYFFVRLLKLNGVNYMDCWYNLKKTKQTKDLEYYNVPRHFFYKVNIINKDSTELYSPDMDEIGDLVKNGKIKLQITDLQSLDISDDYLIVSETPELQKAFIDLEKYASSVYKDTSTFTRMH